MSGIELGLIRNQVGVIMIHRDLKGFIRIGSGVIGK